MQYDIFTYIIHYSLHICQATHKSSSEMAILTVLVVVALFASSTIHARDPYTWTVCDDVPAGSFDVHNVVLVPAEPVIGCAMNIEVSGVASQDLRLGTTATVDAKFMGIPVPIPPERQTLNVCALSHMCPVIASPDEQVFDISFSVPSQTLPCPAERSGHRMLCYALHMTIVDQLGELATCVQATFTAHPPGTCV